MKFFHIEKFKFYSKICIKNKIDIYSTTSMNENLIKNINLNLKKI